MSSSTVKRITQQNFLTNKFSKSKTNKILSILNNFVDSNTTAQQLVNQLNDEQANQFCWYVGKDPAYFIQYQINHVAIMKINGFILIIWKPKYIQYPSMVQFPDLKQTKSNSILSSLLIGQSLKIQVDKQVTNLTEGNLASLVDFLEKFISTYCRTDPDFQTVFLSTIEQNLVTYTKHFISKKTALSYWHCIYDDNVNNIALRNMKQMQCIVKLNISGIKKGYNKCLFLFSCKGQRDGILGTIKNKWMQTLSFLAMVMIFVSIVTCRGDDKEGICQYRDEAMVGGAGLMMAIFGLKLADRKKKGNSGSKLKST